MKTIKVPSDIKLVDPISKAAGDTLTFKNTAVHLWLNDTRANTGPVSTARWTKVVDQFLECKPGGHIHLDDADYELLKSIVEKPVATYPPLVARQVTPFDDAVINASDAPAPERKK